MTITFVGHGYVGLVTAAVFADFGNKVYVIGHTPEKVNNLKKGIIPIFEPGLTELVKKNVEAGRLLFTLDYKPAIPESDVVFIAVGTPPTLTGDADLSTVLNVAKKIAENLEGYTIVATKSTVPTGTNKKVQKILEENRPSGAEVSYASVPEFLREGTAIEDTLHPDRVVIGTVDKKAREILTKLHEPINASIVETNFETAELIKYAANSFLALKISYANAIARLSEVLGADALKVLEGIGMDKRIGNMFLSPGPGYGGSCFPKDVRALISIAKDNGTSFPLLEEVENINHQMRRDVVIKARKVLGELSGKRVAVWGLAFKPNTDDMRDAPAIDIITFLGNDGAKVVAFDPESMENAKKVLQDIEYASDPYDAVKDADLLVVVTDWNEFKEIDLAKVRELMKKPNIIDTRNIYDPEKTKEIGFSYVGVGR